MLLSLTVLNLSACNNNPASVGTTNPTTPGGGNPTTPGSDSPSSPQPTTVPLTGGVDVIGADTFTAMTGTSSDAVRLETIDVTGQGGFQKAWRVTGLKPLAQPYFSQLSANSVAPIAQGDVLVVQFWARKTSSGTAQTEFVFEQNTDPYEKIVSTVVRMGQVWTLYSLPFKAARDYAIGTAVARFRLGYDAQSFELGGVILKNYAATKRVQELPLLGFSSASNAPWRAEAATRIDQFRKANLKFRITDASGQAVPNAVVRLEMTRHGFPFGTAVAAQQLLGSNDADSVKYKQTILKLFNRVVLEYDLKWPDWECCHRNQTLEALRFFAINNIAVRGHTLIWPCDVSYCLPSDVPALFGNPTQLRNRIEAHLTDILGATKGQLVEWDVVNEPSANKRLANVLGEDEMALWYKRVKQLEPTAKLFINDYDNLGEGNLDVEYKRIIKRLLALGAPIEGIGLQAHFGSGMTPPEELHSRLEEFGKFGLPLAITEFDMNTTNLQLQADSTRDFLTVAFANPHVTSFMMWGFWEGRHWRPDAAMYRKDWSIKPNGLVFQDLVFKQWWTDLTQSSDASGWVNARGFIGDYKISVTVNGKTTTQSLKLEAGSPEFVFKLP
jgi:endo-1,4-beta-xylanase